MGFLALTNGLVHTAAEDAVTPNATLLIRDDVIHGVYASLAQAEAAAGTAVEIVDISGMTVLPGMMDCHVHLFFDGGLDMTKGQSTDTSLAAERAAVHLRAGVTTIRELGAPTPEVFQVRDDSAAGKVLGPRVLAAGPIVTVPHGHGWFIGEVVTDGQHLPHAMRRLAERGVDCVKIAVSGGVSTPGSDLFTVQFSEADLRAGVEAAHELGLRVAAHASNPESIRISAAAGIDSVEHAVMIDDAALDALQAGTTVLVPTLAATNKSPGFLTDPKIPEHIREKGKITLPAHRESIKRAIASGVTMAAGTDAGSTATEHGLTAMEAEQLVACGLSPQQAIAAVTRNAATLLGLDDRLGTLESGKIADAVVVAGNPAEDIAVLNDVRLVIKNGKVVHRVR